METTSPRSREGWTGASFPASASPRVISASWLQLTALWTIKPCLPGVQHQSSRAYIENLCMAHGEDVARPDRRQHTTAEDAQRQHSGNTQNLGRKGASSRLLIGCPASDTLNASVSGTFRMEFIAQACGYGTPLFLQTIISNTNRKRKRNARSR